MYTAHVHFFTNLDLFCIDSARVIYRKIRYFAFYFIVTNTKGMPQLKISVLEFEVEVQDVKTIWRMQ